MALTAHFVADFTSFYDAVEAAQVKLKNFETGASKVSSALNRLNDSFSGRKIIQEANLSAKAIGGIEGVSKLTTNEQARLNATITEALAKYKALGKEAPESLKHISAELNKNVMSFRDVATAAAVVAGIVTGVSLVIGKLGERGASVNDVRQSFDQLTDAIGETSGVILGKLRAATLGNISDFELMATVNKSLSQGLKLTAGQFELVGDVAAVLADRTGGDLKTAFDTLTQAMATGQDRTLKTIGFNIDAAKATDLHAASIGKKVSELDEEQKKQAISNAILAEGARILAQSGKAQVDFGDKVSQSRTKLSNFTDSVSAWVASSPNIGAWTSTVTAASSGITVLGLAFGPASRGLSKLLGDGAGLSGVMTSITGSVGNLIPALGRLGTAAGSSSIAVAGLQAGLIGLGVGITLAFVFHQLDQLKKDLHATADAYDRFPKPINDTTQKLAEQARQINANNVTMNKLRDGMEAVIEPTGFFGQAMTAASKSGGALSTALKQAHTDIAAMAPALRKDLVEGLKSGAFAMEDLQRKSKLSETAFRLFTTQVNTAGKATDEIAVAIGKTRAAMVPLTDVQKAQVTQWNRWGVSAETAGKALGISGTAITSYLDTLHRLLATVPEVTIEMANFAKMVTNAAMLSGLQALEQLVESSADAFERFKKSFKGAEMFPEPSSITLDAWKKGQAAITATGEALMNFGVIIKSNLKDSLAGIPDVLKQAFIGGGDLMGALKAIGVDLADAITAPIIQGLNTLQKHALTAGMVAAAGLGGAVGGGIGATVAGISAGLGGSALAASAWGVAMAKGGVMASLALGAATLGIGAAAVGVVMLAKKWFAHRKEVQENTKAIAKFQESIWATLTPAQVMEAQGRTWAATVIGVRDAYLATGRSAAEAEADVKAMWDSTAKGAAASQAAMARVNAAFVEQRQHAESLALGFQTLEETAKKYNITIEEMGPAWQRQELDKKAQELFKDYQILTSAGVDHVLVLGKMAGAVNKYVQDAVKMGIEVPAAMRPMLEDMIKSGQLFDANGVKIENLEAAGISFAMTMSEGFKALIAEVMKLTDAISRGLGLAIQNVPDGDFTIRGKVVMPDKLPKGYDLPDVEMMAAGGRGVVNKPTMFMAGEAGSEEFAFSGANRRLDETGGNVVDFAGFVELKEEQAATRRVLEKNARELPFVIAMALKDAQAH